LLNGNELKIGKSNW